MTRRWSRCPPNRAPTLLLEAVVNGDARAATEAYLEMAPAGENVNRAALLVNIKSVLYEIRRSNLISGSMLLLTPMGGWHHRLGEAMIVSGIVGMVLAAISAMRRDHGQR